MGVARIFFGGGWGWEDFEYFEKILKKIAKDALFYHTNQKSNNNPALIFRAFGR